ncbi:MAG TPA: DUF3467 domain-containing protein [Solirubrobacteraceae bacterium]|jgi:hypothetical protein|nr:DUF3467 domain-containing protein [Solirubrobacteraceae bacterium]
MSEPPTPQQPHEGPQIIMLPDEFTGKWANAAQLQRSPHEFTLDFIRMGPQFLQGQVIARVSFSPLLLSELVGLFNSQWEQYTQEAGLPPENG